ncbi:MAG: exodeoxyribonuclease VII small subunit [Holosporales bacterium]|jgi:exodeoxyribonuclease VII small subunit|nr:exodeoxyribonuclease VII small subunit [Holosporales bacterium]
MQIITDEEISALSFEDALGRLEVIVKSLEQGDLSLDDAVVAFEFGNKLRRCCERKLQEAKLKIEKVIKSAQDPAVSLEPVN